jgi:hypothetical protein
MSAEGFEFRKGRPKGRYGYFAGDKRIVRELRKALQWTAEPYPKREPSPEDRVQVVDLDPVPKTFAASVS